MAPIFVRNQEHYSVKLKNISLQTKLLLLLLSFILVTVTLLIINGYYENRKLRIFDLSDQLSEIETDVLHAIDAQKNFIIHEPINSEFFKTGISKYALENDSISARVRDKLNLLAENNLIRGLKIEKDIHELENSLNNMDIIFHQLADIILLRGYKDYGLEGEMRTYAHELEEDFGAFVETADILMLRRHEKDFIIRREEKYTLRFEYQIELIRYKLLLNDNIDSDTQQKISSLLIKYQNTFSKLVNAEKKIGLKESQGLEAQVDKNAKMFVAQMDALKDKMNVAQSTLLKKLRTYYILFFTFFVLLSILGSIRISKNMTSRIKKLSKGVNKFVESNFKEPNKFEESIGEDEVGELAKNFKVLEDEIVIHFGLYKNKVERRTLEILSQKEELEKKQEIIESKNKDILDSIKYAKKIQDSMLPEDRFLNQLLKEYFVLYKPKDIVSGDFYWSERKGGKIYIAVADCTGHGVPGAFMSIMGNNFMNQAINEKHFERPDQILSYMNIAISSSLGQNNDAHQNGLLMKVQDGMDVALITIDFSQNTLQFSGAQRPLLIVRDGKILEFKGDRFPVGGTTHGSVKKFSLENIQLKTGDNIYLFSDGYADQFGGKRNKKFKSSKLRELLVSIQNENPQVQKKILNESLALWKGDRDQVDDICVFGIRV